MFAIEKKIETDGGVFLCYTEKRKVGDDPVKKYRSWLWIVVMMLGAVLCLCACENTEPEPTVNHRHMIRQEALQTRAVHVESSDPALIRASLQENGDIRLTASGIGSAVLTVRNPYGERFEMVAQSGKDGITLSGGYTPPEHWVLVTDFGAVPNDETEDTLGIQKAIDSLPQGGTVYFPKGVYRISQLILREGVSLRLEGQLQDYSLNYEASGAMELERAGELAVLRTCGKKDMFLNHEPRDLGRNGCSNVTISGGMLDMDGKVRGFVFSCGENIILENTIIKDCPNNHAIQLGGCKNVTIRECLFAGYNYTKSNTGAELIQIEQTHPGAMGNVANTPSVFEEGEFYFCENITISDCYFGASDEYDAPTYAIGHHGQAQNSSVNGLTVTGCVFDNCRCSAIHYAAFSNVTISQNTFINNRDNSVSPLDDPGQIRLFLYQKDVSYTTPDGTKIYYARKAGCEGSQKTCIENNRFIIGTKCSRYSAILAEGNAQSYDVLWEEGILQSGGYGQTAEFYRGFAKVCNVISDLTVRNNTVEVDADLDARGFFFRFAEIRGLQLENNQVTGKTFLFSSTKFGGDTYENCDILSCTTPKTEATRLTLQLAPDSAGAACVVSAGEGQSLTLCSASKNSPVITLLAEGGRIEYTVSANGDLSVSVIADEGKTFRRWKLPENVQQEADGKCLFTFSGQVIAVFE